MDEYWQAVANFLHSNRLGGLAVVAPAELAEIAPIESAYANVTLDDVDRIDALVLHKGRYQELGRLFTRRALARLHASFANEVFIVLTADCAMLDSLDPHLEKLREIRRWAGQNDSVAKQAEPRKRMAATYLGRDQILAETVLGHLMVLQGPDRAITPHIIRDGFFDRGLSQFIQTSLRPGMTYIDVGANVGVYAIIAASAVGATGRVIAIEAIPRLAEMVSDNLAMNGFLARSRVFSCAASDTDGELTIYQFARSQSHTALPEVAKIVEDATYRDRPTPLQVQSRRLSGMLAEADVGHADLIKIDVEGYELQVVKGARNFLARGRKPNLILEWHPAFMNRPRAPAELFETLATELGYTIQRIGPDGEAKPTALAELMSLEHADILARPDD